MARGVAGTGASTGAGTVVSERVEIVTRGERRRSYSAEEKARLVAETFQPGETVTAVSRRHGICTSLLHRWRRAAPGEVPSRRAARPQLLPVRLVAPDAAAPQPKPAPVPGVAPAPIEVVLRNGRVLLRHILLKLQRHQFGRKSEQLPEEQLELGLADLETAIAKSDAEAEKR